MYLILIDMKRIENVFRRLAELTEKSGITTTALADDMGLARPNVSDDLNRLCSEGRAVKEGTKPVLYRAVVSGMPLTVFDHFAERFPSLVQPVEQAKAAVLYPPNGMPMLILGETGTGKSLFASLIHEFAVQVLDRSQMPFFVFNCADYADNANLLVSWLFGARKGTWTGADTDRVGILEKADGGFLFLDEVHRLSPEGQEMLFSFLDKGTFRRLGDTDTERRAAVRIIAATTENPDSALLKTFTRRIPMVIRIPSLDERGMDERLELIQTFYSEEAHRLDKPVYVSVNSIRSLLGYRCQNNVGQLKADIQLLCAKAYSDFVSHKKDTIQIVTASLPGHIKEGLFSETVHREIWHKLTDVGSRFCVFRPDRKDGESFFEKNDSSSIYELIDLRVREMQAGGLPEQEVRDNLDSCIRSYFARVCNYQEETETTIMNLAEPDTARAISEIIPAAEKRLARSFSPQLRAGIAMHVMTAVRRIRSGRVIVNPEFNKMRQEHPDEFAAAVDALNTIDHICEVSMPLEEAGFLGLFFIMDTEDRTSVCEHPVSVVVMMHGQSTAGSMAHVCNDLLKIQVVTGIDVPLNEAPQAAWLRLKAWISCRNQVSDILLLVDMGSLTNLGKMVESELHLKCMTVTMVSTLHALQAGRKAAEGLPLDRIYRDVTDIRDTFVSEPAENPPVRDYCVNYIITVCTTGEGSALTIREQLASSLKFDRTKILIRNFGIAGQEDIRSRLRTLEESGHIIFVVSPFHIDDIQAPCFTIEDAMQAAGLEKMQQIIDSASLFEKMKNAYREFLSETDPDKVFPAARIFTEKVERLSGLQLQDSVRTGMLCHIACMVDRLKKGQTVRPFSGMQLFITEKKTLFEIIRKEAVYLENRFSVSIPDDEICYLASFFHPDNCVCMVENKRNV